MLKIASFIMALALSIPAMAAFEESAPTADMSMYNLAEVKRMIDDGQYGHAIKRLHHFVMKDDQSADAHNLLGYAYRKTGVLDQSAEHYRRALALDPNHRGALEYQGELFLMQGNQAGAQENLRRLEMLCPQGCAELDDLKQRSMAPRKR